MSTLAKAFELAYEIHKDDFRWDKKTPYIFHPIRICFKMKTDSEKIVALLHDTIEDHGDKLNFSMLEEMGYFLLGGFRAGRPMAMAQARELVHDSQMGITYGIMETVSAVIFIVTPPIAGFLFERDPMILYPLAIGSIVVSIVVSSIFLPRKVNHD
jgi:hypothetical protein